MYVYMEEDRFSLLLLERDVLEYVGFKDKYNELERKSGRWYRCCFRRSDEAKRTHYYAKYIQSMRNLETKYRHVNVYTNYHRQLEKMQPIDENGLHLVHL